MIQNQWVVRNDVEDCGGEPDGCTPLSDQGKVYTYLAPGGYGAISSGSPIGTPGITTSQGADLSLGTAWYRDGPGRLLLDGDECTSGSDRTIGFRFVDQNGSAHQLRDKQTNGHPFTLAETISDYNYGRVFVSGDGSNMAFVSDTDIVRPSSAHCNDFENPNPWMNIYAANGYLLLPDGTRYRVEKTFIKWMRDRNGNVTRFFYDQDPAPSAPVAHLVKVVDSLNREINISYSVAEPEPYGLSDVITVKGFGGATRTYRISFKPLTDVLRSDFSVASIDQQFSDIDPNVAQPNTSCRTRLNPFYLGVEPGYKRVAALWLPDGRAVKFRYNNYGELARIESPNGGAFEYDWGAGDGSNGSGLRKADVWTFATLWRRVRQRRVYSNGATLSQVQDFSVDPFVSSADPTVVTVDNRDANSVRLNREKHYFFGNSEYIKTLDTLGIRPPYYSSWKDGKEYQTELFADNGTTLLRRETKDWQQTDPAWVQCSGSTCIVPENNPHIAQSDTTLADTNPNQVTRRSFLYDQFNNPTNIYEYDFGVGAPGGLLRETRTTYEPSSNYTDPSTGAYLLSMPSQTSVWDGGGIERARASFEYDNYNTDTYHAGLIDRSNISGFDSSFSTSYATRGNVTATTNYFLTNGVVTGSVTSYAQYDVAGNAVKTIDTRGYPTTFDYLDNFGGPDDSVQLGGNPSNTQPSELGIQASYAFPFKVTNAVGHIAYSKYDYYLGTAVGVEDPNGVKSSMKYNDSLDRPSQIIRAANDTSIPSARCQTTFGYDDASHMVTTTSDLNLFGDPNPLKSQVVYDGLGRTIETRQYEGGSNYIATKTQYDALGRAYQTSNPFRPWQSESAIWTTTAFDALGRVISVTTPDSAVVKTAYSGNRVLVADQNSSDALRKKRISQTDALGRVKEVWEITAADSATEAVSFPNWPNVTAGYRTLYTYDTLDNLTIVNQGSQTRTFAYDALKRLTSATNPESGPVSYQYDENGNLVVRTDARNVSTHFAYDALNRVTRKWYNGSSLLTATTNNSPALPTGVDFTDEVRDEAYSIAPGVVVTWRSGTQDTSINFLGPI